MGTTYRTVFYKTLELPEVQKSCFGRELCEGKDVKIKDFKRVHYSHGYDDIQRSEGSAVSGKMYELTRKDFEKACEWERAKYVPIGVTLSDDTHALAFQFRKDHKSEVKHLAERMEHE